MKNFLLILSILMIWLNASHLNARVLFASDYDVVEQPIADAGPDQEWSCDNSNIVLGSTNSSQGENITYTWTNEDGDIVGNQLLLRTNQCGTYALTVEGENGCLALDEVTIICDIFIPYPEMPTLVSLNCDVAGVLLEPNFVPGSLEFGSVEWTDEDGNVLSTDGSLQVTECGVYTLTIFSIDLPCPISMKVTVSCDFGLPFAVAELSDEINCETILLEGNGSSEGDDFEYTWLDQTGNVVSMDLNTTVSEPGIYTLIVTNTESGCTSSATVLAPDNAFSAEVNLTLACDSYIVKAFVDGSGFYEYTWSTGERVNPITLPFDEAYSVTVTSLATGCELVLNGNTPEGPPPISTTSTIVDAEDFGNGLIDITVAGGTEPYTFEWSNGASTEDIEDLPGEYTVTITDATGCVYIETFSIDGVNAIQKIDANGPIKLYPNPSHGVVKIDAEFKISSVQIFDARGKQIYFEKTDFLEGYLNIDLSSGIYIISLKSEVGDVFNGKLIVSK